ncbi:MAG TPA: hypothetical protein VK877_01315 [Pseudolabrys sp.]|nr:hypothetical protein [Pseudolabrys sp.]
MVREGRRDGVWKLSFDLWSAKVIVWAATVGRDAVLTHEAHLYFFDRYHRLAEAHRMRGNVVKAARLDAKAEEHWGNSGGDGPPFAAAMAMPRPRAFVTVNAVSPGRDHDSDDAA